MCRAPAVGADAGGDHHGLGCPPVDRCPRIMGSTGGVRHAGSGDDSSLIRTTTKVTGASPCAPLSWSWWLRTRPTATNASSRTWARSTSCHSWTAPSPRGAPPDTWTIGVRPSRLPPPRRPMRMAGCDSLSTVVLSTSEVQESRTSRTSRAWQRAVSEELIDGLGAIVAEYFDEGCSRRLAWPDRVWLVVAVVTYPLHDRGPGNAQRAVLCPDGYVRRRS
jgi:hypothetical protein